MSNPFRRSLQASLAFIFGGVLSVSAAIADPPGPVMMSPLSVSAAPTAAYAVPLELDLAAYADLRAAGRAVLVDFPLQPGLSVDLEVEPFDVLAGDVTLLDGDRPLARPDLLTLRGHVVNVPDSHVFLGLSPLGSHGTVDVDGQKFILSSGPFGSGRTTVIYNLSMLPPDAIEWTEFRCRTDELRRLAPIGGQPADVRGGAPCRLARIALESDYEFTNWLFGGNTAASTAYATLMTAAATDVYMRDLNMRLQIDFLRVWSTSSDPWNQGDTVNQLYQFQDYWNANMTHIQRNAAHFLSGRGLGGGVAYLPGMCYPGYDYALSANLSGFFPYPLQNNHSQNWDAMVYFHEFGHIFAAPHTHQSEPPIDGCGYGDCSVAPNGTIMSYCHLCSGGMVNIILEFHPQTVNQYMLSYMADPNAVALCDMTIPEVEITQQPAGGNVCVNSPLTLSVVANGSPTLTYQWRRNSEDISGATQSSYQIPSVNAATAGSYSVVVSNTCGSQTSDDAVVGYCPHPTGDLTGDCNVDLDDLSILLVNFGGAGTPQQGDLSGDGNIDLTDLSMLLVDFGFTC